MDVNGCYNGFYHGFFMDVNGFLWMLMDVTMDFIMDFNGC